MNLNQTNLPTNPTVDIVFTSPSRPTITLNKALTSEGGGFFSFTITQLESESFIDNSYVYEIQLDEDLISLGNVRLV